MKFFIFLIIAVVLFSSSLYAQSTITYQGKLLDNNGLPVNLNNVAMSFAIYDGPSGSTKLWPASNPSASKTVNVEAGIYSVILGTGSGNDEVFVSSAFSGTNPYLEVTINATTLPRVPISAVPVSLLSNGLSASAWASPGNIGSTTPGSAAFTSMTLNTGSNSFSFPSGRGQSGEVLTSGGDGTTSWSSASGGTVSRNSTLIGDGSGGSPLGINLANANTWTANQTFAGTFLITANSRIAMTNSDNNARDIRLQEPSGTGSQYLGFRAPSVSNNGNYLLPAVVGSVGQSLTISSTNGIDSASLHWATPSGGIPVPAGSETNDLLSFDGTNWVAKALVINNTGSGSSISNMQPYLVLNYCIALEGIFPSQSADYPYLGEIMIYPYTFAPADWAFCHGQLLSIAQNSALFALIGTIYGGDGQSTFGLPDLRGRTPIGAGTGSGLSTRTLGQMGGAETFTISVGNLPSHSHTITYQ